MTKPSRMSALLASIAATALLITGCGSDDSPPERAKQAAGGLQDMLDNLPSSVRDLINAADEADKQQGESGKGDKADANRAPELKPLQVLIPAKGVTPKGWNQNAAVCEDPEAKGWTTYAVPNDWKYTGYSSGSGSTIDENVTLRYDVDMGSGRGEVSVELKSESRDHDGTILDGNGEKWTSFDYDWSSYGSKGEKSGRITFDSVGTVKLAGQRIEIFYADPDQEPDMLGTTLTYKARFELANIPNPAIGDKDGYLPASYVITVEGDADRSPVTADTVKDLVASLAFPDCSKKMLVIETEVRLQRDVDGDGHVTTPQEYAEALRTGGR